MTREINISELADMLDGRIEGRFDKKDNIKGTCAIYKYISGKVSFITNLKYGEMLAQLHDAVILVPESLSAFCEKYPHNTYIVVKDVISSMMNVQEFFYGEEPLIVDEGVSHTARIDSSAIIGKGSYIGENVYIGRKVTIGERSRILQNSCIFDDVFIGNGTYIYPHVCVYKDCQIGNDCLIHSGARIGADGFRFEHDIANKIVRKMYHCGEVMIGDRVEIGANCTIDRATFEDDATILADDVKLDDQVHIGHNAKILARSMIAAQTCISGSVKVGEDVWIGAGVTISNNVSVGDRAKVLLNAVVAFDVLEDEMVSGFYAMPHKQWKIAYQYLRGGEWLKKLLP